MDMLLEPMAWLLVALASLLGNLAFYELGKEGVEIVTSRFPRIKPGHWHRATGLFQDRGAWILLLSGVPGWDESKTEYGTDGVTHQRDIHAYPLDRHRRMA
jgi:membrane protein YqaA with SNARE-associated domain